MPQSKFNFFQCEQDIFYLYTGIEVLYCNKHSKVFFGLYSINLNGCGTSVLLCSVYVDGVLWHRG